MNDKLETLCGSARRAVSDIGGAVRTGAAAAGQAAENAAVRAKWKAEIARLEAERDRKLQKIGELVYATHTGRPTASDTLNAALREVDDLREQIADRRAAIAIIRGSAVCGACRTANPVENAYCIHCGQPLR